MPAETPDMSRPVTAFMRTDFIAVAADDTVARTLTKLRRADLGQKIIYLYVVEADGVLVGVLPTRRLLMSAPDLPVRDIMQTPVLSVPDSGSLLLACEMFVMHRLLAFPVVDGAGRILGIVDVSLFTDEMFQFNEQQAAQDVFQLIGVHLGASQAPGAWAQFRQRFPWLLCNIAAGLACAMLITSFETFLDQVIVLALFMPVVLATAESMSMQSVSLTLQRLHAAEPSLAFFLRQVGRELPVAALIGLGAGILVGGASLFWRQHWPVAVAIGGAIAASIITAALLGVLLPTAVRWLRGDPRIAAGPIVLAAADLLTLLIYFRLAGWMLGGMNS